MRASHDEQYSPGMCTKFKNCMLIIFEDIMPEVQRSMKEKGIPAEQLKDNKVDTFHMM
jgi:hypothetical protein